MRGEWQLQQAKGNFSQLIKRAASGDVQMVNVHRKPIAVVVSAEEYARLTRRRSTLSSALLRPDDHPVVWSSLGNRDLSPHAQKRLLD